MDRVRSETAAGRACSFFASRQQHLPWAEADTAVQQVTSKAPAPGRKAEAKLDWSRAAQRAGLSRKNEKPELHAGLPTREQKHGKPEKLHGLTLMFTTGNSNSYTSLDAASQQQQQPKAAQSYTFVIHVEGECARLLPVGLQRTFEKGV